MQNLLKGTHIEVLEQLTNFVKTNKGKSKTDLQAQSDINLALKWIVILRSDNNIDRCISKINTMKNDFFVNLHELRNMK
jgi:hypothetical protein